MHVSSIGIAILAVVCLASNTVANSSNEAVDGELGSKVRIKRMEHRKEKGWRWPHATVFYTTRHLLGWDRALQAGVNRIAQTAGIGKAVEEARLASKKKGEEYETLDPNVVDENFVNEQAKKRGEALKEYNDFVDEQNDKKQAECGKSKSDDELAECVKPFEKLIADKLAWYYKTRDGLAEEFKKKRQDFRIDYNNQASREKLVQTLVQLWARPPPPEVAPPTMASLVRLAMTEISSKTCIRFVELKPAEVPGHDRIRDFLDFRYSQDGACFTELGHNGYAQIVHLSRRCAFGPLSVAHEIMHSLGFGHEHTASDRETKAGLTINYDLLNDKNKTPLWVEHKQLPDTEKTSLMYNVEVNPDPYCYESILQYQIHADQKLPINHDSKALMEFDVKKHPLPNSFHHDPALGEDKLTDHDRLHFLGKFWSGPLPQCDYKWINKYYECPHDPKTFLPLPGTSGIGTDSDDRIPCDVVGTDAKSFKVIGEGQEKIFYSDDGEAMYFGTYVRVSKTDCEAKKIGCFLPTGGKAPFPPVDKRVRMIPGEPSESGNVGATTYTCSLSNGKATLESTDLLAGCAYPVGKIVNGKPAVIAVGEEVKNEKVNIKCVMDDETKIARIHHLGCARDVVKSQPAEGWLATVQVSVTSQIRKSDKLGVNTWEKCVISPDASSAKIKPVHCTYKEGSGKEVVFGPGCYKEFANKDEQLVKKIIVCRRDSQDQYAVGAIEVDYLTAEQDKADRKAPLATYYRNIIYLPKCDDEVVAAPEIEKKEKKMEDELTPDKLKPLVTKVFATCHKPNTDVVKPMDSWAIAHCKQEPKAPPKYIYNTGLKKTICEGTEVESQKTEDFSAAQKLLTIFGMKEANKEIPLETNADAARCFLHCIYQAMKMELKSEMLTNDALDLKGGMFLKVLATVDCTATLAEIQKEFEETQRAEAEKKKQAEALENALKNKKAEEVKKLQEAAAKKAKDEEALRKKQLEERKKKQDAAPESILAKPNNDPNDKEQPAPQGQEPNPKLNAALPQMAKKRQKGEETTCWTFKCHEGTMWQKFTHAITKKVKKLFHIPSSKNKKH